MLEKPVEEKIPWIPLIALTAVLSFLAMLTWRLLHPLGGNWNCFFNFGATRVSLIPIYPFILLWLAYPFVKTRRMSSQTLVYLYVVGLVSSYTLGAAYLDFCITLTRLRLYDTLRLLDALWWQPSVEVINAMIKGGIATNWAEWGPVVFVMSFLYISLWFFTSSITLIFRRSWIDIDKMPFPVVIPAYETLNLLRVDEEHGKRKTYFYIGLILAFLFMLPAFMARTFPWFPDIYGWREIGGCPSAVVRSTENDLLGSTLVWYSGYSKNPVLVAIFLLAPVNVSFNVCFWTLVVLILEQLAYYMGFYTGALSLSGLAKLCCPDGVATAPPFYWPIISMAGGYLALTVMYLLQRRSYIIETLKLAFHGNPDIEKNEVISYRSAYIILIVSAISSIIALTFFGINALSAIIILIVGCVITWFALTIIWCTVGFGDSERMMWAAGFLRILWPDPSAVTPSLDYVMSHFWLQIGVCVPTYGFGNGFFETASVLKMADLIGVSNRKKIFLLTAICMIVAVPVFFATSVWTANLYGSSVLMGGWGTCSPGVDYFCDTSPASQAAHPSVQTYATYITIGFLWTMILAILRARFVWFPFDPIGFIIATSWSGMWQEVWSVFLAAWIIKTIVLRVGGSVLYEKYVVPTVGGFISGVALVTMIGVIVGVVRFFIPF